MSPTCVECGRPFIRSHAEQRYCGKVRGKNRCKERAQQKRLREQAYQGWLGIDSARQRLDDGAMVGDEIWFEQVDEVNR